jgi:hypothetical protein
MTAIVWTTLITAVATVSASLGAVWIKSRYDDRTQARQATEAGAGAASDRRRDAYADLVRMARLVLEEGRRQGDDAERRPDAPFDSRKLYDLLAQSVPLVELIGSQLARSHAEVVHDKAKAVLDWYTSVSDTQNLYMIGYDGKSDKLPPTFDPDVGKAATLALDAAIDSFVDSVRPELGGPS